MKPIRIRQSAYLNNRIEQDHRHSKRRIRSTLGLKAKVPAAIILSSFEMVHIMSKQAKYVYNSNLALPSKLKFLPHDRHPAHHPSRQKSGLSTEP
ncbi:hypothetical protein DC522_33495 [Microvirga sp. KLBC 81]|nr:hypothetical protein DC522_33495 [Microvirga sp. KLBC 81]